MRISPLNQIRFNLGPEIHLNLYARKIESAKQIKRFSSPASQIAEWLAACFVPVLQYLLLVCRWPEMVTFEEMNLPVPLTKSNIILRAMITIMMEEKCSSMLENGFIAGAKQMLKEK